MSRLAKNRLIVISYEESNLKSILLAKYDDYHYIAGEIYEQNNLTYFKKIFIDQFEDAVKNYFN